MKIPKKSNNCSVKNSQYSNFWTLIPAFPISIFVEFFHYFILWNTEKKIIPMSKITKLSSLSTKKLHISPITKLLYEYFRPYLIVSAPNTLFPIKFDRSSSKCEWVQVDSSEWELCPFCSRLFATFYIFFRQHFM